ncbi:hypothetical protein HNR05_001298 [Leifsonia psychrotolerans]|uniref:Uncharacterized protein n=1 Tax=Glaciibacter psychrotolerans TaxID=670054 RepID=A0A7Z0J5H8_9MICO|nr:hypothetical protein [Leifsonia psychrotolerans]
MTKITVGAGGLLSPMLVSICAGAFGPPAVVLVRVV